MPPSDDAMIRHLATAVMGWEIEYTNGGKRAMVHPGDGTYRLLWTNHADEADKLWNPFGSWADAGMAWERARERGITVVAYNDERGWHAYPMHRPILTTDADSGPRAICLAVARATGYTE